MAVKPCVSEVHENMSPICPLQITIPVYTTLCHQKWTARTQGGICDRAFGYLANDCSFAFMV